jgi:hypothetical protein
MHPPSQDTWVASLRSNRIHTVPPRYVIKYKVAAIGLATNAAVIYATFPGLKVLGLTVFSFTSVLQKTQNSGQSRETLPRSHGRL